MSKTWTTKEGETLAIKDMDDNHLLNTIRFLERGAERRQEHDLIILWSADPMGEQAAFAVEQEAMYAQALTPLEYLAEVTPYKSLVWHAKRRGLLPKSEGEKK